MKFHCYYAKKKIYNSEVLSLLHKLWFSNFLQLNGVDLE